MKRRTFNAVTILAFVACAFVLVGCATRGAAVQPGSAGYTDDQAVEIIAGGYEARADYLATHTEDTAAKLKGAVQTEIDHDQVLKNAKFEDTKLQETVISYLNALDGQMDVLEKYPYDSIEFNMAWDEAFNNRSQIMRTLVNKYGLTVGEKYQEDFDVILTTGNAVASKAAADEAIGGLIASATWEKVDNGYGGIEYVAVVENTSDYDFKNVNLNVGLYDADDVRTDSYAHTESWKRGEKVRFTAYNNGVDAQRVEAEVDYYEVAN